MNAAEAVIALIGKDQASPVIAKVRGELGSLGSSSTVASAGMGKVGTAVSGMGGAMKHAGSQVMGLVSNIGLFAGAAGIGGIGAAIGASVRKVEDFGATVRQVSDVTGLSTETASALAAAFEHVGISADSTTRALGMLEKNAATNTLTTKASAKFYKEFGLQLADANGRAKDANTLLLQTADYFNNKTIPAATKALALSKLYGRSWQDLVPLLKLGSTGIAAAEAEAQSLGLTLTSANMAQLVQLRNVQRTWGDTLGGLELQIGLTVIPALTSIGEAANKYLGDPNNRKSILGAITTIEGVAGKVAQAIVSIGGALAGLWGKIPGPMQQLLVGGFVANKAASWLFGTSPLSAVTKAGTNVIGGLLGNVLGKVPGVSSVAGAMGLEGTRVFVTNWPLSFGSGGSGLGNAVKTVLTDAGGAATAGGAVEAGAGLGSIGLLGSAALVAAPLAATAFMLSQGKYDLSKRAATGPTGGRVRGARAIETHPSFESIAAQQQALTAPAFTPGTPESRQLRYLVSALNHWAKGAGGPLNANAVLPSIGALSTLFETSRSPSQKSLESAIKMEGELQQEAYKQGNTALGDAIGTGLSVLQGTLDRLNATIANLPSALGAAMGTANWNAYRAGERGDATVKLTVSPRDNNNTVTMLSRVGGNRKVSAI